MAPGVIGASGCRLDRTASKFLPLREAKRGDHGLTYRLIDGGETFQAVFFKFGPGTLHFNIQIGRELCADPIIGKGAGLVVFAPSCLKRRLQIFTSQATHVALHSLSFVSSAVSGMRLIYSSKTLVPIRRRSCHCRAYGTAP